MRIAEMVSGTAVNGAAVNCLEVAKALRDRGHQVTLVVRPNGWPHKRAQAEGLDVIESSLKRNIGELRRIARELRRRQIDVLHTHMSSANFFGVLLRRLFGIQNVVATAHNRYFQPHWMFNDRVIAVSEATRSYHNRVNMVPKRRIDVVHNFIDDSRYRSAQNQSKAQLRTRLGFEPQEQLVGVIGDVIPRKGLIYLIRALPGILKRCPEAKVVCVGHPRKDYAAQVRQEAEDMGVHDRIAWLGPRSDIDQLLSILDLYALPSIEENLPLSILEAMASGLPVVATAVGGIPECVDDGTTGLLVPPANPAALTDAITKILSAPQMASSMAQLGQRTVREGFSVQSQVRRIENVFSKLVA